MNAAVHFRALLPGLLGGLLPALLLTVSAPAAEEVKASHILVKSQDEADVIRNEVVEKGGDRKAFMDAARKYSKDTTTKRAGGALGWFTRAKMVKEFSEAAFEMKNSEISQPVKSQYGWHLILLEDRRETAGGKPEPKPAPSADPHEGHNHPPGQHPAPAAPVRAGPADLAPGAQPPAVTPAVPPGSPAQPVVSQPAAPGAPVKPERPKMRPKGLKLVLDIPQKIRPPSLTVEVDLTLNNNGEEDLKVFASELLPLGFTVNAEVAPMAPPAAWDDLKAKKPEAMIINLPSRRSIGQTFTLNDYFKDLPANGRYRLVWNARTFFQNLEQAFPEAKSLPDYETVKATYNDPRILIKDSPSLNARSRVFNQERALNFAIVESLSPTSGKKYLASIEFERLTGQPVWVELFLDRQPQGVQQFGTLALEGFYDGLSLFDIQKGNYIRTGCPRDNGTGAPERLALAQNTTAKIPHEAGTISMLATSDKSGSKQIGSIFFICRKAHPEWDQDHVPIGKIISGAEVLDRVEAQPQAARIAKISVLPADKAPANVGGVAAAVTPAAATSSTTNPAATPNAPNQPAAKPATPAIAPTTVKIKTAKGEVTVEMYETESSNTVANFIELLEKGYFNADANTKKAQTFYAVYPGVAVVAGSPTNDSQGGPGYRIPSETADNKRPHEKGTLTMLLETDPISGNPVPDSAGSQFMICLQDIPAWNGIYTPFGKVTEGLDVLEKIQQGDPIESVSVLNKRNRPYKARTIPPTPGAPPAAPPR